MKALIGLLSVIAERTDADSVSIMRSKKGQIRISFYFTDGPPYHFQTTESEAEERFDWHVERSIRVVNEYRRKDKEDGRTG